MQQVAVNRARLAPAIAALLADLPAQAAAREVRAAEERDVSAWVQKQRDLKRQAHRLRREQQHAEALASKKRAVMAQPRHALGRMAGAYRLPGEDGEEGEVPPVGEAPPAPFLQLRPEVGLGRPQLESLLELLLAAASACLSGPPVACLVGAYSRRSTQPCLQDMHDMVSERRGGEDDVFCAVCGSGEWLDNNMIVMCGECRGQGQTEQTRRGAVCRAWE